MKPRSVLCLLALALTPGALPSAPFPSPRALPDTRSPTQDHPGMGSRWVAGSWSEGPSLRDCPFAPNAPLWRIYTPPHHEVVPRAGYAVRSTRPLPRLMVRYACTGLWLHPVVVRDVRTMGYVLDVTVTKCR